MDIILENNRENRLTALRHLIYQYNDTQRNIARSLKISEGYLSKMLCNDRAITERFLIQVANRLGYNVCFWVQNGKEMFKVWQIRN